MVDMVGKTCLLQFVSSDVSPPYGVSLNNPLLFQWAGAALVLFATWHTILDSKGCLSP
jgi:hypothetical protein